MRLFIRIMSAKYRPHWHSTENYRLHLYINQYIGTK